MRITFKTVQNKLFTVEANDSETVADLKKKIQESQTFPAENQKLIYSGKILKDDATVGGLNIKEKDFLVVMVSKPKPVPAAASTSAASTTPAVESSTPAAASTPAAPAADAPAAAESTPASTDETAAPSDAGSSMGGSFLTGTALSSAIDNLVEMGFPRDQVVRAMRASFNNPDRAAEYLMTGNIPETEAPASAPAPAAAPATPAAPAAAAPAAAAATPAAPAPRSGGGAADNLFAAAEAAMVRDRGAPAGVRGAGAAGAGGDRLPNLEEIANHPQMARIREAVQNNPALIQPLLQQIATTDPELAEALNQDPQALYHLLGLNEEDMAAEGEGDFEGPQVMQVNLTEEEVAAVERLEQFGFPRQMVLQAFLLCDKNEELAANFLFEESERDN